MLSKKDRENLQLIDVKINDDRRPVLINLFLSSSSMIQSHLKTFNNSGTFVQLFANEN